jgi:hypothetical protein
LPKSPNIETQKSRESCAERRSDFRAELEIDQRKVLQEMKNEKNMKLAFAIVTVSCSIFSLHAQNARIEGTVTDENGARLANATIVFNGPRSATVTSSEIGDFSINLPAGEYEVVSRAEGFCKSERTIMADSKHHLLGVRLHTCAPALVADVSRRPPVEHHRTRPIVINDKYPLLSRPALRIEAVTKKKKNGRVIYSSGRTAAGGKFPVLITHNFCAFVVHESVEWLSRKRSVLVHGPVVIDCDGRLEQKRDITITFGTTGPTY